LLNGYFFLKRLGQSDQRAFGLEKSDVITEEVPLVYNPVQHVTLTRTY
jgi:KUP system potassium uptake protein